jgi:hypothetical protein
MSLSGNWREPVSTVNAPPVLCVVEDTDGYEPTPDDDMVDSFQPVNTYF